MARQTLFGRGTPIKICVYPDCGRPAYARGYCQTHHLQFIRTGELRPIRHYRRRIPGTEKFAGLRLSPVCIEQIERKAEKEGLSNGAAIAAILEAWGRAKARER